MNLLNGKFEMKLDELRQKVALLKDGQVVEIDGLYYKAKRVPECWPQDACYYCNIDCLCHGDVAQVCTELDFLSKSVWYLTLES